MSTDTTEKIKVMVVEDDSFISEILQSKLSEDGYIISSTKNGGEAVGLAKQTKPDIIILDLMLPGMDGKQILVELKKDSVLKDIPVIVFTNLSDDADRKAVMALGAAEYLVKVSTELSELKAKIDAFVKKH